MSIPVLNELTTELSRVYAAGSRLAIGDPRLRKYIQPLEALGQKAPVFGALAERLTRLVEGDEKSSPENLMELGGLLHSVLYTQGATAQGEHTPVDYPQKPLRIGGEAPYSQLSQLVQLLDSCLQNHSPLVQHAYESGIYLDPRLYRSYCNALRGNRGYISNYVADVIIPAVGQDMVPFLMDSMFVGDSSSAFDARLFECLYKIQGADVLPLAEEVLKYDSAPMLQQAVYALAEDAKYEEALLSYAADRRSDIRKAAFVSLTRLGSQRGDEMMLAGLEKPNISHLHDALVLTPSEKVMTRARQLLMQDYAALKDAKLEKGDKSYLRPKTLLRALAAREDPEDMAILEEILGDDAFCSRNHQLVDLHGVIQILIDANTPVKSTIVYKTSEKRGDIGNMMLMAPRLFTPTEVYDRHHKLLTPKTLRDVLNPMYTSYTAHIPGDPQRIPDEQKLWDRRWATKIIDLTMVSSVSRFIYDDDVKAWKKLLELCVHDVKTRRGAAGVNSWYTYIMILNRAFEIKHPDAQKTYDKYAKYGVDEQSLEQVVRAVNN